MTMTKPLIRQATCNSSYTIPIHAGHDVGSSGMGIRHRQLAHGELKMAWASWNLYTARPCGPWNVYTKFCEARPSRCKYMTWKKGNMKLMQKLLKPAVFLLPAKWKWYCSFKWGILRKMLFYAWCWAHAYGAGLADFLSYKSKWLVDFFS